MYALNGIATTDSYPEEPTGSNAILVCPDAVRVNIRITQANVTCQMKLRAGMDLKGAALPWGPDVNLGRSLRSIDRRVEAIRFKSTVAGSPGLVDVEAMTSMELPG